MTAHHTPAPPRPKRWLFWAFLALAAFYLIVEHRTHLAGSLNWLPLGFLLLCPLMHVLGHGKHGGHGGHGGHRGDGDIDHARMPHPGPTGTGASPDDGSNTLPGGR